jgi:hypothetical protein
LHGHFCGHGVDVGYASNPVGPEYFPHSKAPAIVQIVEVVE